MCESTMAPQRKHTVATSRERKIQITSHNKKSSQLKLNSSHLLFSFSAEFQSMHTISVSHNYKTTCIVQNQHIFHSLNDSKSF